MSQTAQIAQLDSSLLSSAMFRNRIINPRFSIAQRGASLAAGTGNRFGPDRFMLNSVGSTIDFTQWPFPLGQTDVPGNPRHHARINVSSVAGAANNAVLAQRVEAVRTFAGQKAVLSFYAKAAAPCSVGVEFTQFFGTGGAPSATVNFGTTALNLTTSWQRFSVPVTVPSISGKAVGSGVNDYLQVTLWLDAGSSFAARAGIGQQSGTFDIADMQFEEGAVATPFEFRPESIEMQMCMRYYEHCLYGLDSYGLAAANGGYYQPLRVIKRANPTAVNASSSGTINCAAVTYTVLTHTLYVRTVVTANGSFAFGGAVGVEAEL